ncbi:hypothetical protein ABZ896_41345 [Streptomyces sp. NPDC047072]|uniref:hypothetical protein n=1 Tax=Streptomyces sp. NPDC047072 TaxID=3154809 RepID=UPI0033CD1ECA
MPQPDHPDDQEEATWLTGLVVEFILRYTQPREHVLVLSPRTDKSRRVCAAVPRNVAESSSRLGRTVVTRTVDPVRPASIAQPKEPTVPESVPGRTSPTPDSVSPDGVLRRTLAETTDSERTGSKSFGVVIACLDTRSADWVEYVPWNEFLGPTGLLAFITYGHHSEDDPTSLSRLVTGMARCFGLVHLDQITLSNAPDRAPADVLLFIPRLPGARDWK